MTFRLIAIIVVVATLLSPHGLAEEPAAALCELSGSVLDSEGMPAENVRIEVFSLTAANGLIGQELRLAEVTTDASGKFQIDGKTSESIGFLRVTPSRGPFISRGLNFPNPSALGARFAGMRQGVKMQLSAFQAARFEIVDENGSPVPQASVHRMTGSIEYLGRLPRSFPRDALRIGVTNEAGIVDDYVEMERPQFVWVVKEGYLVQGIVVSPPQQGLGGMIGTGRMQVDERPVGQDAPYRITLQPSRKLVGRIIDSTTGLPVAAASVAVEALWNRQVREARKGVCSPMSMTFSTDKEGRFSTVDFPSDPLRVFAWSDDRVAGTEVDTTPLGMELNLGNLPLGDGVRLSGQLWDADAQAQALVDDAKVTFRSIGGTQFIGDVNPDGSFDVRVPEHFEGIPYLLSHPEWAEHSSSKSLASLGSSVLLKVVRRPPVLGNSEVLSELAKFPIEYGLREGQLIHRFDRPYRKSREAFFQCSRFADFSPPKWMVAVPGGHLRRMGSDGPTSPNGAVFVVDSKERMRVGISTHGRLTIGEILMSVYPGMGYDRIRTNFHPGRGEPVLGDFVVREHVPISELVPAINEVLEQDPPIPFHLTLSEARFLTAIVKNRPRPETFAEPMTLQLIPTGYDGPTEVLNHKADWGQLVDQIVRFRLGVQKKLECEDSPELGTLQVEVPRLMNQTGNLNPAQLAEAAQARKDLERKLREIAPAAFKSALGVELEIREVELPVVTIDPM